MKITPFHVRLLAGAGACAAAALPAVAQINGDCTERLEQIRQQAHEAELSEGRRWGILQAVDAARSLADSGDQQGCMRVVADLDIMMESVEAPAEDDDE